MDQEYPQVYLITPGDFEPSRFGDQLGSVLDGNDVSCVRLALTTKDELEISKIADPPWSVNPQQVHGARPVDVRSAELA